MADRNTHDSGARRNLRKGRTLPAAALPAAAALVLNGLFGALVLTVQAATPASPAPAAPAKKSPPTSVPPACPKTDATAESKTDPKPDAPFRITSRRPILVGAELLALESDRPRPLRGWALVIDLRAEGLEFVVTPDNGDKPGHVDGARTSTFLADHKLAAAVNASPFGPIPAKDGAATDVSGLMISSGKVVSPAAPPRPALVITRDNKVRISAPPVDVKDAWHAVCGFNLVLEAGKVTGRVEEPLHPRTAAGVSADGRTLVLLVVDGRQPRRSEGLNGRELGGWLAALGCSDGINLDGGGTTTLAIAGPDGKPVVVNRPVHLGVPGLERVAGSHLGLRGRQLPPPPEPNGQPK